MLAITRFNRLQNIYKTTKQVKLTNPKEKQLLRERNILIDIQNLINAIKI
jgi:hypothetical protein